MENVRVAAEAVLPFLLYIAFGYCVRLTGIAPESFFKTLNKVVFRAFFPVMMFHTIYKTDTDFQMDTGVLLFALISLLALILLLCLLVPRFIRANPVRGVFIQAVYRSNFVLFALPLTISVCGEGAGSLAAMLIAIVIPIYNVAAVVILETFREGRRSGVGSLLKGIVTNPMILGAAVGLVFFLLRLPLPIVLDETVEAVADMSTPLALFVLGATLHFKAVGRNLPYLTAGLILRLLLIPAAVVTLAACMGFRDEKLFILFALYGTPVATASYAMAENMGGDGELAGQFVVFSTVASILTIFLWILVLRTAGLI